jgi:DNA-binding NarL/FixJ family response regulator
VGSEGNNQPGPPDQDRPTTVLVVDDDRLVRLGLSAILNAEPDLAVVGEAADGVSAISEAHRLVPDVVIMDVRMPRLDGIEATRAILASRGATLPRVLVATTFEFDDYVYEALAAGASGFVLKRVHPDELIDAVRVVARGESLVFPVLTRRLIERFAVQRLRPDDPRALLLTSLTDREGEVLRMMAAGSSNLEMAQALFLSMHTIKTHVGSVLAKLGARDRTQAVVFAYETGFVTPQHAPGYRE